MDMDKFFSDLSSLSWWLGVVVVGIGINILSPYLSKGLDKILVRTSTNFRNKAMERSEKRKTRIDELKTNQHKQIMFAFKEQRLRIRCLDGFVSGSLLTFLGIFIGILAAFVSKSNIGVLFSGLIILSGFGKLLLAINDTRKVAEIRNILNEIDPDIADSNIVDWL